MKILIVHLISNGDILYATPIAKQIKESDYPGSHLTWAVAENYKWVLLGNPYVDAIWEVPIRDKADGAGESWHRTKQKALQMMANGDFDKVFFTQIGPDNWHNFNGMLRSSIWNNYPHPRRVSVDPIVTLTESEVEGVREFAASKDLSKYNKVVLFECSPQSFQSFITPQLALQIAESIASKRSDVCFILSSAIKVESRLLNVVDGSVLTIRQNAELTKYCHLLIGCSSGITWISTSTWAKPLPMIQLLNRKKFFASVQYDFKRCGKNTDGIIETTTEELENIILCVETALFGDFSQAKKSFGETLVPFYSEAVIGELKGVAQRRGVWALAKSYVCFTLANGLSWPVTKDYLRILKRAF